MNFDQLEYSTGDFPTMPQTLRLDGSGRARYESHTNEFSPDFPEIGLYESDLSTAERETVGELVETSFLRPLSDHWGKTDSGDRFRRLRVRRGKETIEKLVGTDRPVDAKLQNVFDALDRIILGLRAHPVQALRIDLAEVSLSRAGRWTAILTLTNRGSQAISCWKPSASLSAPDTALRIEMWPDKPPQTLRPEDLSAAAAQVAAHPGQREAGTVPIIELAPLQSALIPITGEVSPLGAGAYLVRASYSNMVPQWGKREVIAGEVFSKAVKAVVR